MDPKRTIGSAVAVLCLGTAGPCGGCVEELDEDSGPRPGLTESGTFSIEEGATTIELGVVGTHDAVDASFRGVITIDLAGDDSGDASAHHTLATVDGTILDIGDLLTDSRVLSTCAWEGDPTACGGTFVLTVDPAVTERPIPVTVTVEYDWDAVEPNGIIELTWDPS